MVGMRRFFNKAQSESTKIGQQEHMGQYFNHLRRILWSPEFEWVETSDEAADIINKPHEDFPDKVPLTKLAIETSRPLIMVSNLIAIHIRIFEGEEFSGLLRNTNVEVDNHTPPDWTKVMNFMIELQMIHRPKFENIGDVSIQLIED